MHICISIWGDMLQSILKFLRKGNFESSLPLHVFFTPYFAVCFMNWTILLSLYPLCPRLSDNLFILKLNKKHILVQRIHLRIWEPKSFSFSPNKSGTRLIWKRVVKIFFCYIPVSYIWTFSLRHISFGGWIP